jgi:hypothetical protein
MLENQYEFPAKRVGCPGTSVKEQALSDLAGSILATFQKMSNKFLHCFQVIDSKPQKEDYGKESYGSIAQLGLLSC